ncbi:MAG: YifB family Mg chelatase-like AAA ATPase [Lachnospiraceae bacterium]|nr:YifB family Mg chelatase-like AAA ATPase [Lachnospiraceae bacterium]
MYSKIHTAALFGIESIGVEVEADVNDGLPVFDMVGFLGTEVKEAREKVRTALRNCGYRLPPKRITVNLSPGGIKKSGSGFDLPVAVALLCAMGVIDISLFNDCIVVGELSLDGRILPVNGVLSIVLKAKKEGFKKCLLPRANKDEALMVSDINIYTAETLTEIINFNEMKNETGGKTPKTTGTFCRYDFKDMNGQKGVRRACEIAVSGRHNMLMVGPPGSGKSFAARCIPGILPSMNENEMLDVALVYSASGDFDKRLNSLYERPYRSPHHTVTAKGLSGGGVVPKPGEISLANKGVLFLDELAEYNMNVLETLREPLEDKYIKIVRASGTFVFPADFMLVAAMNPCSCGFFPDRNICNCTRTSINRYMGRISQPLLDRIDVTVEAPRLNYREIAEKRENESSNDIRKRVDEAVAIQNERYKREEFSFNSEIPAGRMDEFVCLTSKQMVHMKEMYERLNISARSYHKILKVARTIADVEGKNDIETVHLNEAICYRSIDKKEWEKNL